MLDHLNEDNMRKRRGRPPKNGVKAQTVAERNKIYQEKLGKLGGKTYTMRANASEVEAINKYASDLGLTPSAAVKKIIQDGIDRLSH